jgi:phosphoribosylglycinamide formyltransferase, formyltetrahydrofolate-dependent
MSEPISTGKLRLGVLASGRGSNLQAVIDAIDAGTVQAGIAVVISNKGEALALERARIHGVTDVFLDPKLYAGMIDKREAYDRGVLDILRKYDVDLVLLAGYMRIVTPVLIEAYRNRMMNIHPSLLPSFPGLEAQKQALEWAVKVSGCTVHFVTEALMKVPSFSKPPFRSWSVIHRRRWRRAFFIEEHKIYPRAVQLYAEGRLHVEGRRVRIADSAAGCV